MIITNIDLWVPKSTYNIQMEVLKSDILNIISRISAAHDDLENIKSFSDLIDSKLEK